MKISLLKVYPRQSSLHCWAIQIPQDAFGLRNAAQAFQQVIDTVCQGLESIFMYIDNILVASTDVESHRHRLRQLFK